MSVSRKKRHQKHIANAVTMRIENHYSAKSLLAVFYHSINIINRKAIKTHP